MSGLDRWEPVIGLEVHAQLSTASKIFCGCSAAFGAEPNEHTCPVCLGHPGVLPVLNRRAVEYAIRLGAALGARVREESVFARKNYFYPDLPKGYQISQYELPVCEGGEVPFVLDDGTRKSARLVRIHLEEDAGKSIHARGRKVSLVDLNRAGVPLLEIVSAPELRSAEEAAAYLKSLRSILRTLEICDGNMEEGSLRCDANVSLRPRGDTALGTRTEIKNVNSFRFVQRAIDYEIRRQAAILAAGGEVEQETRLYDASRDETRSMRGKEEAHDYRYFPDPDLPPLRIDPEWVAKVRAELPELPLARAERFVRDYGLDDGSARLIAGEREVARFFETAVAAYDGPPKTVANWVKSELLRELGERGGDLGAVKVRPEDLARLLSRIDDGTISASAAKTIFAELAEQGGEVDAIIDAKGLKQVSETGALESVVEEVLQAHPEEVQRYRSGKKNLIGFFMGQVMKATGGKANPKVVRELLLGRLEEDA